ncbi:MAK10-like protein [Tanacetum coccineum]
MGDENPIRTLVEYSKPSHEGYRNTIELPVGNNVVPLRSDTIQLVQNRCSFHGLRTAKLRNDILMFQQHHGESLSEAWTRFKDLLQKVPHHGIDLWLQYCMEDPEQAFVEYASSHTDEAGGLVSNFMASQDAKLTKFEADFKQQQSEMTNKIDTVLKAITDRLARSLPSNTEANISQTSQLQPGMRIGMQQPEEPEPTLEDEFHHLHLNLPVLEVLAHAPIYNAILDKYVESLELGKNGSTFVQGEVSAKMEDPGLFTLPCRLGDSKPFNTLADLGSCVNIIPLYIFKKLNIGLLEETSHIFRLADITKSYPVGIVKDLEVHIGKLKLLNDFYVINLKKDPETPLFVGRGFLATANAVIDCRMAKITVGEGVTRSVLRVKGVDLSAEIPYYARKDFLDCHLPKEWEIARDVEINAFKDVLVFRRMVEFLGAIPIKLKSNMWESEDLINKPINWNKPPKMEMGHGMPRLDSLI